MNVSWEVPADLLGLVRSGCRVEEGFPLVWKNRSGGLWWEKGWLEGDGLIYGSDMVLYRGGGRSVGPL